MNAIKLYNNVNNSFKKKLIYHVGSEAGFYSEINAMLSTMLYCYVHKIKFILYADDANFTGGNGWNELFMPFCPQNHDRLNHKYNSRSMYGKENDISYCAKRLLLKIRNGVNYLTDDIFGKFFFEEEFVYVQWHEFGIDGEVGEEYAKLRNVALKYNKKTFVEIKKKIQELALPAHYYSVQFRGGDKNLEFANSMDVDLVIDRMKKFDKNIENIFIFTDDYSYVKEIKEKCPEWNVYTLTKENEHGYDNADFNKIDWGLKRREIIKLLAMTEICIHSDIHFGCEVTCVNQYIKNVKSSKKYRAIWTEDDASIRAEFVSELKKKFG